MGKRRMDLIILCEDIQQEVFARAYLMSIGWHRSKMRFRKAPQGRGAGEQFVRDQYSKEVYAFRRHATQNRGLVIMIDADTKSVEQTKREMNQVLVKAGLARRGGQERIALIVPKRNIETWIHFLMGKAVNEGQTYHKFRKKESQCKSYVKDLVSNVCPIGLSPQAPSSLHEACDEIARII